MLAKRFAPLMQMSVALPVTVGLLRRLGPVGPVSLAPADGPRVGVVVRSSGGALAVVVATATFALMPFVCLPFDLPLPPALTGTVGGRGTDGSVDALPPALTETVGGRYTVRPVDGVEGDDDDAVTTEGDVPCSIGGLACVDRSSVRCRRPSHTSV